MCTRSIWADWISVTPHLIGGYRWVDRRWTYKEKQLWFVFIISLGYVKRVNRGWTSFGLTWNWLFSVYSSSVTMIKHRAGKLFPKPQVNTKSTTPNTISCWRAPGFGAQWRRKCLNFKLSCWNCQKAIFDLNWIELEVCVKCSNCSPATLAVRTC